ncbi:ATP synthase F0 subunit A [Candidatus Roizmanbacteria bacterium RIFCSPHIGHO2_02_FULL_40_13b]|uniref:ATP synthase subunit a n=1 Tax=Candidatus Roizmanbacteria bacterium RIFCSPHIGHO2_01_FULL_39_24 TaxID=1802032 RepID=A0A1F7GFJ8_9BACT|nr:MAG: ATP synthase F0 subunit A [Candidatus Roizmanbacteria bacterium RIFCSPHIGHO2_01_FULL_39_24]OGK26425.1 MAG: ATP synthase F0 subunit A [Candidatus Roizmanbacteria bacterium RIFCSPHIGHO2_02_FULL_40_13b]OGK49037.1 MAG: ATP synthase F0 subunit A [Candidatus Roizmanbacteria bacterium RIFCSPLOWO2_01_FULL_40_32]OGK57047.1 MAG: ATP synthase F0 subunit A [Candidatus Roizmanbacteria bacterium RIFCSPLOWO2_02_FULL_39_8]
MLHISIKPEVIFHILGQGITNSLLASLILTVLFVALSFLFQIKSRDTNSTFVFFIRYILTQLYNLYKSVLQEKVTVFFPVLGAFFFFILLSNWIGLIPGVGSILIREGHESVPILRAATADLNTTVALALISVVLIQVYGIKYIGIKKFVGKFLNFSGPIAFFTGILEIVSEISKVLSFAFRLFGNIFAGEVLISVVAFLIPILASFPFLMLEIFVGFIQAIVFSMLSAVFLSMSTAEHH